MTQIPQRLRDRPEGPWALWSGVAGALLFAALSAKGIFASGSATAAFGFVYLPLAAALAALPVAIWGAALGHVLLRLRGAVRSPRVVFLSALAVAAALPVLAIYELQRGLQLEAAVREARAMDVLQLDRAIDDSPFGRDRYFLAAVAQNPRARAGLLARISAFHDPELYEPLGSLWDVMGENGKGLAVMRLVAAHPNTDGETLARLADGPAAPRVLLEVLANPRAPQAVLQRHYESTDASAEQGLALNPKTPQRVMERLAASRNLTARSNLAYNKATPREILERLAGDAEAIVSRSAQQAIERRKRGGSQ